MYESRVSRVIPGRMPARKWPPLSSAIAWGAYHGMFEMLMPSTRVMSDARQIGSSRRSSVMRSADAVLVVLRVTPLEEVAGGREPEGRIEQIRFAPGDRVALERSCPAPVRCASPAHRRGTRGRSGCRPSSLASASGSKFRSLIVMLPVTPMSVLKPPPIMNWPVRVSFTFTRMSLNVVSRLIRQHLDLRRLLRVKDSQPRAAASRRRGSDRRGGFVPVGTEAGS